MSSYPTRRIRTALLAKGFEEEHTHHVIFRLIVNGRKTGIRTRISHGAREYGDSLLAAVARDMGLRKAELDAFVQCPMSYENYIRVLAQRGMLRMPA